ncbi:MAG TPA: sugar phosphate isomerase/epimerase [Trebonia sp.]|jgi:fatty-acyl-CoA synthase|nr:sugar phosphate isomerase/epimerase [Trebonia sp.]
MTGSSRLAFSTLAFPGTTLARAAALGSDYGYQGIELRLIDGELIDPSMPASARAEVRQTVADTGLPIVAVDSSIKLTGDDPGQELSRFLELASDWECPLVRVFGGGLSDAPRQRREEMEAAARVLEAGIPHAERTGVAIGVETHDSFSSAALVAELLALVDSPKVGAVWDSHHPYRMGETPAEVYAAIGPRLLLAQVKDARRAPERDDGWQLTLLGQGEVPVKEMLDLLDKGGYQGWISVEWEKRWHPEIEDPEVALPQHLKLLDSWLSEARELSEATEADQG